MACGNYYQNLHAATDMPNKHTIIYLTYVAISAKHATGPPQQYSLVFR